MSWVSSSSSSARSRASTSSPTPTLDPRRRRGQQLGARAARRALPSPVSTGASCRFCWLGTDKPLEAFTFIFHETEHGLFQVHAYPFEDGMGDLDRRVPSRTSGDAPAWPRPTSSRRSPTARSCSRPGSTGTGCSPTARSGGPFRPSSARPGGTTMSSCWATRRTRRTSRSAREPSWRWRTPWRWPTAFEEHGTENRARGSRAYQEARWVDVHQDPEGGSDQPRVVRELRALHAASTPIQFTFNLMTRSKQITWDNLAARDPSWWRRSTNGTATTSERRSSSDGTTPPPIFTPFRLRAMELVNRDRGEPDVPVLRSRRHVPTTGTWCILAAGPSAARA